MKDWKYDVVTISKLYIDSQRLECRNTKNILFLSVNDVLSPLVIIVLEMKNNQFESKISRLGHILLETNGGMVWRPLEYLVYKVLFSL